MSEFNMEKTYNPQAIEKTTYEKWENSGAFTAHRVEGKKPFTIVMPPPNVTGQLHMGHAMDGVLQDSLIRYHRMKGDPTLWLPGTDHASIATEVKVVEKLRKEGLTKEMLGREGFLEHAWAWKNEYGGRITRQLRRMGASCDWSRERFTMDEGCSKAVREVFVRLYEKGLIYQGNRLINWCPCCNTSISDAEVEYEEKDGNFWHILYPVKETGEMLELATTRPETMLGDTAVAINPEDPRYKHLHGCHVVLPLINKEIPIVCDEHADMEKGTGVVKITPAHDPNDYEVGQRHALRADDAAALGGGNGHGEGGVGGGDELQSVPGGDPGQHGGHAGEINGGGEPAHKVAVPGAHGGFGIVNQSVDPFVLLSHKGEGQQAHQHNGAADEPGDDTQGHIAAGFGQNGLGLEEDTGADHDAHNHTNRCEQTVLSCQLVFHSHHSFRGSIIHAS